MLSGVTMANAKGRVAEGFTCKAGVSTCTGNILSDEFFSYSARGEVTDTWEWTPNSGAYYHPTAAYWANGALKTMWISSLPTISYGADSEGRTSTVSANSGQNPVTATSYNTASQVTGVTFGSADSDTFGFDANTGRMTQYKFTVNGSSEIGNLTWNQNGSLKTLAITDPFNAGDAQTCNYLHDDLGRLASSHCGTTWSQDFSIDPFGNTTKTGSISWQPGYTATTNRYTLGGTSYDANGNLLADTFHTYTWDANSKPVKIDAINLTYDAFDRVVEQNPSAGLYYQIVYTPMGTKLGLFKGATIQQLYVPLPGGARAEYYSWGLSDYRHPDWLGSNRLESSTTRTVIDNNAYAPYGEPYAQTGNGEISFTGQNKDTDWLQYDFLFRQYDPKQGRWISPDPVGMAAVNPANPQTWNRYAYVMNSPLNFTDPLGLFTYVPPSCPQGTSYVSLGDYWGNACAPPCPSGTGYIEVEGYPACGPPALLPALGAIIQGSLNQCPGDQNCSSSGGGSNNGNSGPPKPPVPKPPDPVLKYDQCATTVRNQAEHNSKLITVVSGVTTSNLVVGCAFTGPFLPECEGSLLGVELLNEGVNQTLKYSSIWDGEAACMQK